MNVILLSGGSGKRLWPLSNDIRSKQFLKVFKKHDGTYESMIQRVYRQVKNASSWAKITVATSKKQVSAINSQLGDKVSISAEPCRRDTFPAIALACAYLVDKQGVNPGEVAVVCPVDPMVGNDYFRALIALEYQTAKGESDLVLMGIEPTYASEKYGYIVPKDGEKLSNVKVFKEKPTEEAAQKLIEKGALWNGGVFAFKIGFLLNRAKEILGYSSYQELYDHYDSFPSISFDYAIAEKERKVQVMRFGGQWKDLGTWNTLSEAMSDPILGNATMNETCSGVQIINEMDVPILAMGLHDVVISASPEGILVSDKEQSSYIKPYVDEFEQRVMFAEKSWGSFKVLDVETGSMTIKVTLNPGHSMNYHSHQHRDEVWVVIAGEGEAVIDEKKQGIKTGDIVMMKAGCKHTVKAISELKMVEVQLGAEITAEDKQKYDYKF